MVQGRALNLLRDVQSKAPPAEKTSLTEYPQLCKSGVTIVPHRKVQTDNPPTAVLVTRELVAAPHFRPPPPARRWWRVRHCLQEGMPQTWHLPVGVQAQPTAVRPNSRKPTCKPTRAYSWLVLFLCLHGLSLIQ